MHPPSFFYILLKASFLFSYILMVSRLSIVCGSPRATDQHQRQSFPETRAPLMQLFQALKPFLVVSLMHLHFLSAGISNVILLHSHMAEIVVKRHPCSWPSWLCRACLCVCLGAVRDFYTNYKGKKNCSRQLSKAQICVRKI